MPRGGYRENAGGKPTWRHGKTKTIRVPVVLANEVLKIARDLDEKGIIDYDTGSKVVDLSGIRIRSRDGWTFIYLEDMVRAGYIIRPERLFQALQAKLDEF